ncbi:MAG: PIN domain-containing protein [Leptolyngbyaceae cyanobacterium bins.59]|nr:PIN domain-containing protein [Leptolyngbyaceae cyanobacterium bins.59]
MSDPFPTSLVLDISALMASKTRDWQEFSRVGTCFLPGPVVDELKFLCDRASDSDQEKVAREFSRFHPTSGWQTTDLSLSHPSIKAPSGSAASKNARLMVSVAECAYGLAESNPEELIVLVSNSHPLLQMVQSTNAENLCGITLTALLQWARTHQKPPAVVQQGRTMQAAIMPGSVRSDSGSKPVRAKASPGRSTPPPAPPASPAPASAVRYRPNRSSSSHPGFLSQLISGVIALTLFTVAGLAMWQMVQPASFRQFWKRTGLPALPWDAPSQQTKPVKR